MRKRKKATRTRSDTSSKPRKKAIVKRVKAKKASRVPKTRNASTMTESAFWSMLRSTLRRKYMVSWIPSKNVRLRNRIPYTGISKRQKYSYICEECKKSFSANQTAVHHIVECGSLTNSDDLKGFVDRLFCEEEGLTLLCNSCHDKKHIKNPLGNVNL
jgi:hypothetical protein